MLYKTIVKGQQLDAVNRSKVNGWALSRLRKGDFIAAPVLETQTFSKFVEKSQIITYEEK